MNNPNLLPLLAHALQNISECVSITDKDNKIIYVNKAFLKTYGYEEDELIGKNIDIVRYEEQKYLSPDIISQTMTGGYAGELLNIRKNGTVFPIRLSSSIVHDDEGNFLALVGVAFDLTQQKKEEKILRDLNSTKDKFFSIISHDLKQPFNSISGFSELLYQDYDEFTDEERKSFILNILESSKSAYSLLQNLLDWAISQTDGLDVTPGIYDLATLVNNNIIMMKSVAGAKGIKLVSNIEYGINVLVNENLLNTIIRNLVSNAIRFSYQGGQVNIHSEITKPNKLGMDMIAVTVEDFGVGILKEEQEKLFVIGKKRPSFGTAHEKGTGLGLILCKEFVEKMGGSIRVESEPGKGSRFIFTIPTAV